MEVIATAKYVRTSPQKVRIVVDQIRKMKPHEAVNLLDFVNKRAAKPLKKVIASAIANARHNSGLSADSLVFKTIQVSQGNVFKRYQPVSRGRAHKILKRTSHIKVVLEAVTKEVSKASKVSNVSQVSKDKDKKPEGGYRGPKS